MNLLDLKSGDLLIIHKVKTADQIEEVCIPILISEDPALEKVIGDSYWWVWAQNAESPVYLLQWVYPYGTGIMAFTSNPIAHKNGSQWTFTILEGTISSLPHN